MGVTQDKGRSKPRPPQRPSSPRGTSVIAPDITTKTKAASPPACRKEEEKLSGMSAKSSEKSVPMNITNISTKNTNITKVVLVVSKAKDEKKNEKIDKNETEDLLSQSIAEMSLNEDANLNKKLKNLSIKDDQKEKEQNEESDLVSRGPDRTCIRGMSRTVPYVYQQHIVSADRYGGGTVLYPNISTAHTTISYVQNLHQGFLPTNLQNPKNPTEDNSNFPIENDLNYYNSEVENFLQFSQELPHLNAEDVNDVLPSVEEDISVNDLNDQIIKDLDKIIEKKTDDKDLQTIKRELCEGAMDKHLAPTTPDSAYESDECSVGSPLSVSLGTSGLSDVMRFDRENTVTNCAPYTHVATQPINLQLQTVSDFAPVSNSRVLQTAPVKVVLLPKQTMPPPAVPQLMLQPQHQPQPLAPSSTPPLPQGLRPILPGINIPPACNRCSEPAINRIRSAMLQQTRDAAWAIMFHFSDSKFTAEDEDGNMLLSCVLSSSQKIRSFMEVFYALIQRLKDMIKENPDMASKLLATPNKNGHTPLDIACRFLRCTPQNALAVRYLADTMVEVGLAIGEEVDGNGNSLLHRLTLCGDEACYIMAELLSMKDQQGKSVFDVNKKNNEGKTPLHIAAQTHSNRTSCAVLTQLLMRSGADVSVKEGCAGNTVFHLVARESCDPNLLLMLLAKTSHNYVRKVINEKNFNEDTPLHMVAANHAISPSYQRLAVQHMIDYGADPKLQNKSHKAPLSLVPAERKQDIKNVLYQKRQLICHE